MDVLVTGGAGFIGSHLCRALILAGHRVRVVDDLSTGRRANLEGLDVEFVERDLAKDPLEPVLAGAKVVIHLAAVPSVPRSVADPLTSHAAAATATLRLLIAAREVGIERLIAASSSSVYGNVASPPMREDMPTLPRSPYAVAKLAAEGYVRAFAQLHQMRTVSLRYFNVFGPGQDPASQYAAAIPRFITSYMQRTAPIVFDDGRQSRDFTYVENVVDANIAAMAAPRLEGQSVNVAAGAPHSVLDLLDALAGIFGYRLEPRFMPPRPGDIRHSHADIARAGEVIGYRPRVTFEEGLRQTVEWMRSRA